MDINNKYSKKQHNISNNYLQSDGPSKHTKNEGTLIRADIIFL